MNQEALEQLDKEELIRLVLEQAKGIGQLKEEIEALKLKLEQVQGKPQTTSKNSSQPPSRDQKVNRPKDKRKHRHGPPKGHEKHERKFVVQPDQVVELRAKICTKCETELEHSTDRLVKVNQITELPEAKAEVIEVRQYESVCSCCGAAQMCEPPTGMEMERAFGTRLETTVVYYRQEQHLSYERTQLALLNLHGVEISQGGIDGIMQRAGEKAIEAVKPIEESVRQSEVVYSDETGSRVDGSNWWEWVFCTVKAILHVIRFNRSCDVIKDVMGSETAEVWGSDGYTAQLKAPAQQRQLCLGHQLRNLQAVVDANPTLSWPRDLQGLFREAIHLHHQRHLISPEQFAAQVARIEGQVDQLLHCDLDPPDARRVQRRYLKHRNSLFVFLHRPDVEPTNNVSERALRHSVIHRKVTGCFRSEWGAKAYAALASIIDTAELSGVRSFSAIQSLFAPPCLPLPLSGE